MSKLDRWLIIVSLFFLASSATFATGNVELGKKKAETCLGCHAVTGYFNVYPSYRVPKLGGQNIGYLVNALNAYKNGTRMHATMQANAFNLTDEEILDIATYMSSLK
tara:strand:+ start:541 stop:861 length:321 start_codon:yes stop_codon:yes gene_type:complete